MLSSPIIESATENREPVIAFESYVPHPEKKDHLAFGGVKSSNEIKSQITDALKSIQAGEYNALDVAEWVSMDDKYNGALEIPVHGAPIVFWVHGGSEGEIVEIHLRDSERKLHPVCRVKFLMGGKFAQVVTGKLIDACQRGLYGAH
jgi:hypothetical protein